MKILAPLLIAFALLTDPQGHLIYIVKAQVVAIVGPTGCSRDAHATVVTASMSFCVAEDMADAARKTEWQ
jgi:hypothetical protein